MDQLSTYNPLPGIETYAPNMNPTLKSANSTFELPFYQTKESLMDVDTYRAFLKNCEAQFRHSVFYTKYKGFLYGLGYDHCQVHGYLTSEMTKIEMHHAILTLFDLCLLITEHFLNTVGYVTTFDVIEALKEEHSHNNIPIIMLSETPHDVYHENNSFYLHPDMCIGKWKVLLEKYKMGMTQDIAFKLLYYFKKSLEIGTTDDAGLLDLRDKVKSWSEMMR
jgi:hypothetical protein